METVTASFTVYFEDPFWVGLCERECGGRYEVCRVVFGAEPKDAEVYAYLLANWKQLKFSPPVSVRSRAAVRMSPKRLQRQAQRALENTGVGTKAQQALKLQQEQGKIARRERSKQQREEEALRRYALRQEKRKEKHRGH